MNRIMNVDNLRIIFDALSIESTGYCAGEKTSIALDILKKAIECDEDYPVDALVKSKIFNEGYEFGYSQVKKTASSLWVENKMLKESINTMIFEPRGKWAERSGE